MARVVVLAARFASGAPLGRRRTDATFLSAGTRALSGVPGWFTTAEPGWWAFWPGWKRAAVRWAAVAVAAGLYAHPLVTGAVLGWLALLTGLRAGPPLAAVAVRPRGDPPGLPPALPVPRHRPGRQARPVAGHPAPASPPPRRGDHAGLPGHLEPRHRPAEGHRPADPPALRRGPGRLLRRVPGHLGAPARPAAARPVRGVRPARPPHPPGHPGRRRQVDRGPARRGTAPVHRGRDRRRQDRHRLRPGRARPRTRLAGRHHRPQTPLLHRPQNRPGRAHQRPRHPRAHRHRIDDVGAGRVLPVHARGEHRGRRAGRLARRVPAAAAGHR